MILNEFSHEGHRPFQPALAPRRDGVFTVYYPGFDCVRAVIDYNHAVLHMLPERFRMAISELFLCGPANEMYRKKP